MRAGENCWRHKEDSVLVVASEWWGVEWRASRAATMASRVVSLIVEAAGSVGGIAGGEMGAANSGEYVGGVVTAGG